MARKKSDTETIHLNVNDQIIKEHGDVILSAEQFLAHPKKVVSISPSWDWACGGIPQGSWVVINGPPKSGKTSSIFQIMANAQQQLGMKAVFVPVEGRLKERDIKNIHNLDTAPDRFEILYSTKENILSAEKQLEILNNKLASEENLIVFIDSLSVLMEDSRMAEFGKKTRGGLGQILYDFCGRNCHTVPLRNHIIVGVIHTIANTGNGMTSRVEKMPSSFGYQHDIKATLQYPWKEPWLLGNDQIGIKANWLIETHGANIPPNRKFSSRILFNHGISHEAEVMDFAIDLGIIDKAGAWYKYRKNGEGEILLQAQGWESFFDALCREENKEIYNSIYKEVFEEIK